MIICCNKALVTIHSESCNAKLLLFANDHSFSEMQPFVVMPVTKSKFNEICASEMLHIARTNSMCKSAFLLSVMTL